MRRSWTFRSAFAKRIQLYPCTGTRRTIPARSSWYRDKLILYGCGDFVDDYEGIRGHEQYRDDLSLLYLVSVQPQTGNLIALRMAPMQARQMRLRHASSEDAQWLRSVLNRISRHFGVRVDPEPDGMLAVRRA